MHPTSTPPLRAAAARLLPALAVVLAFSGRPAPAAPAAAPKPYLLYLGADLDVQHGKELCRVQDVSGDQLIVRVDGKLVSIPTNEGSLNLRVHRTLKLANAGVTLADLKVDRVYSRAGDPMRKFFREQPGTAGQQLVDLAQGKAIQYATTAAMGNPASPLYQQIQAEAQAAQDQAVQTMQQLNAPIYNAGDFAIEAQNELSKKLFDAIEFTFDVSSPVPLTDPYILILVQYHEPNAPKGTVQNWIFAKALNPIDRQPHKVTIIRGGFPKGYELEKYQVHLYNHGQELANSAAEQLLPLTRDEAFQYTVIEYLANHKDADAPATPVLVRLPPDLQSHLSATQYAQIFYVKVSKDGLPEAAYSDASCDRKVTDPYLHSLIEDLRFTPKLERGRPIEGLALVKFSQLH